MAEVAAIESLVGNTLPEDIRTSFQIHDGQDLDAPDLVGEWSLLTLADSSSVWSDLTHLLNDGEFAARAVETSPECRPVWWDASWVPIAANGSGDLYVVDLAPTANGRRGQIVEFRHDQASRSVVSSSSMAWLASYIEGLRADAELREMTGTADTKDACPQMAELLGIAGRRIADADVKQFVESQPMEVDDDDEETASVLTCNRFGYDVTVGAGRIARIDLYMCSRFGRAPFTGTLLNSVLSGDQYAMVRAKLGSPAATVGVLSDTQAESNGSDRYVVDGKSIFFQFQKGDSGITAVVMIAPD